MNTIEFQTYKEQKSHTTDEFPYNTYLCTIPLDFPSVPIHWHEEIELIVIQKGKGLVTLDFIEYEVEAGNTIIVLPGHLHSIREISGERMEYENIIFKKELLFSAKEDIINSTNMLFRGGWTNVKLYFMIGLPTETMDDVCGIADLAQKVLEVYFAIPKEERAKQINITVSTSSFVPKPFTAFQWAKQDTRDMLIEKQNTLKSAIKSKRIRYNWHDNKTSYLEGVFARGDRRLSEVIIKAVENGCKFDGWGEHFKFDVWMQTFDELGIDPNFYTARERSYEEVLPWDHIDIGVTKNFLMRENEKAKQSVTTPNCRQKCAGCGVKSFGTGVCYE